MGRIESICISSRKGIVKKPVRQAEMRMQHGIVGDAHAGEWHRQVSLLAMESIARVREHIPHLADGAFAENLVTSGINVQSLRVGDRLHAGRSVLLEVTQIGKECHTACVIRKITGDCIMPREGVFCRVLAGGHLRPGDEVRVVEQAGISAGAV